MDTNPRYPHYRVCLSERLEFTMKMSGGCYCGDLRFEISEQSKVKSQCHCRECQYISGGGPNYFMLVPNEAFKFTNGEPKSFSRPDIENPVTRSFCSNCGTHILTIRPGLDMAIVKAGTLDDPSEYGMPSAAIFTCDAQPFHNIPEDMPKFEKLPKR